MNAFEYEELYQKIRALPCFKLAKNETLYIERVSAGQSSMCFDVLKSTAESGSKASKISKTLNSNVEYNKIISASGRYFVKYASQATYFQNEIEASKLASEITLSPKVIYANEQWLVTHYIDAESLDNLSLSTHDKIEISMGLMEKCHTLPSSLPFLNLDTIIGEIVSSEYFSIAQKSVLTALLDEMPTPPNSLKSNAVLCHGDINFSNILVANERAWLIDFECCSVADKEFDIAMFIAINTLSLIEQEHTLTCYEKLLQNKGHSVNKEKLCVYLIYAYLINGLWYLARSQGRSQDKPQGNSGDKADQSESFYHLAMKQFTLFDEVYSSKTHLVDMIQK